MSGHPDSTAARLWLEGLPPGERALVGHLLSCPECARATLTGPPASALPPGAAALDYADDVFRALHVPEGRAVRAELAQARELVESLQELSLAERSHAIQADERYQTAAFALAAIDAAASRWQEDPCRAAEWARLALEAATPAQERGASVPLLLVELARAWGIVGYARAVERSMGAAETAFAAASACLRDGRGVGSLADAFICRLQAHAYAKRERLTEALAYSGRAYALFASQHDVEEACAELIYFSGLAARADLLEQAVDALNRVRLLCGGGGPHERIARRRLAWLLGVLLGRPQEAAAVLREPMLPAELADEATQELSFLAVLDALDDRSDLAERRLWLALAAAKSRGDVPAVAIVCLHLAALGLTSDSAADPVHTADQIGAELAWCEQHAEPIEALRRLRERLETGRATLTDVLDAADVLASGAELEGSTY